jgi:hypothetical protein
MCCSLDGTWKCCPSESPPLLHLSVLLLYVNNFFKKYYVDFVCKSIPPVQPLPRPLLFLFLFFCFCFLIIIVYVILFLLYSLCPDHSFFCFCFLNIILYVILFLLYSLCPDHSFFLFLFFCFCCLIIKKVVERIWFPWNRFTDFF